MLQYMVRGAATRATSQTSKLKSTILASISCKSSYMAALEAKFYRTVGVDEPQSEQVARQMIQYALGHARSQKSGDSYAQSLMVLEQGISNLRGGDSTEDALGMLMLAISTLLYESGELQDSLEKLQMINQLGSASLALKGNIALNHGEFSHATGNLLLANDLYEKVLHVHEAEGVSVNSCLASSNMISEEVLLGVTCALGQLLSHSGKFNEAEELLTKALTKAESHFGPTHPKVGVILTCIALMYKQKAKLEASSAILIQEGLYRRALDMLKAPPLDSQDAVNELKKKDVIALARGGYAEILCIQQNRKGEGERMKKWAETTWKNRRMSLAEALEISEPSKYPVVDVRICRVL